MSQQLDNSAAKNAQSLLNGIDYAALIGGPLEAAVRAQAMAANSTWAFIKNVGLRGDDDNREAINVTFIYQKDGKQVRLIVPILTIVPIPMIVIDDVTIAFKANINASASQTTENSSSDAVNVDSTVESKLDLGIFSMSAKIQASYSSKKDSKATQDSRYSVEYTQDVSVHATQADMPAGLATVLNILSLAATDAPVADAITHSPQAGTLNAAKLDQAQPLTILVTRANGLRPKGQGVTIAVADAAYSELFVLKRQPLGEQVVFKDGKTELVTDGEGQINLDVLLNGEALTKIPANGIAGLKCTATVDKENLETQFDMRVIKLPSNKLDSESDANKRHSV